MGEYANFRATCAQVLTCLSFNCLSVSVGFIISMPMIVIGSLRQEGSTPYLTMEQASWYAGLVYITQPVGSFVSGMFQDLLGRKLCLMMVNIPMCVAWLLTYSATSVPPLFVANIIMGVSLGFLEAPIHAYVGEVTEPRLRGVLCTFAAIFYCAGMMIQMLLCAVLDWRNAVLVDAAACVVAFCILSQIPESPAWLVSKGKIKEAQKSFQFLRGWVGPEVVQQELDKLISYVEKKKPQPRIVNSREYSAVAINEGKDPNPGESQFRIFLHPSVQQPFRLIVTFFFVSTCASLIAMRPFIFEFLQEMKLPLTPNWILVICKGLTLVGAVSSTLAMRFVGKRGLTFASLTLCVTSCFGLGLYLSFDVHVPWIPLCFFAISFYSTSLGILSIPWILVTELYPLRGRGLATGVTAAIAYIIMFLVIKTYYTLVSMVTMAGACLLYGVVGVLGFVYLYLRLPETEGISLEDIEKRFGEEGKNSRRTSTDIR